MNRRKGIEERIYAVWWGFLKLSKRYKEFCYIVERASRRKSVDFNDTVENYYKKKWQKEGRPYDGTNYDDLWELTNNWDYFGNVHNTKFGDWWDANGVYVSIGPVHVIDLSSPEAKDNLHFFDAAYRRYRRDTKNKIPSNDEFLKLLT
ncbi:hypothetical protein EG832_16410, partial [bacterium]|nr:hypothetical protein [bacterium]